MGDATTRRGALGGSIIKIYIRFVSDCTYMRTSFAIVASQAYTAIW